MVKIPKVPAAPLASLLEGTLDLGRLQVGALTGFGSEAYAGGALDAPGVALRFDPRRVQCGVRDGLLIASLGRPRFRNDAAPEGARILDGWAAAYRQDKAGAARGVSGAYAVLIADFQARTALLACDRFARETLCFSRDGARVSFGDRADAVAKRSNAAFDMQAIYNYLWFHFVPAPQTIFKGVHRLPGGETAHLSVDRTVLHKHWMPMFDEHAKLPYRALRREFRELVKSAVGREAARGNAGCFLSGGTDSSTIAGMLREVTGQPARSYSIGFAASGYDETEYARIAAQHFNCKHHEHYITPDELVAGIPRVAAAYDQPFGNSSTLPAYYCAAIAKADGIDTLLGGDGGDELFGGNERYAVQQLLGAYSHLPAPVRRVCEQTAQWSALSRVPVLSKAASYVNQASTPMPDRAQRYNLLRRMGHTEIFTAEWLANIDIEAPLAQQRVVYQSCPGDALINRMLAYDWKYTLADNDLRKVVTTSALAGVEVAFPLLDDALTDFSLRLAPHYKLRGLKLRYFFKKALNDFLPPEIIRKKKHGFGLPFGRWLTRNPGLHELAFGALESISDRGWVRRPFIDDLFRNKLDEHPGYYGEMVWILMMLELWMQANAAQPASVDVKPPQPALA